MVAVHLMDFFLFFCFIPLDQYYDLKQSLYLDSLTNEI